MTVAISDTIARHTVAGVGPYNFESRVFSVDDLAVTAIDTDGAVTTLSPSQFTVDGVNDEDGCEITLTSDAADLFDGQLLDTRSNTPISQGTRLGSQSPYSSKVIETALDRSARELQDIRRLVASCLRVPDNEDAPGVLLPGYASRANTTISFDADGNVTPTVGLTNPFSQGVLDAVLAASPTYAGINAVPLNLRSYIEDDGAYNVFGFLPQNLKSKIRDFTTTDDHGAYWGYAITAAAAEGHFAVVSRGGLFNIEQELELGDNMRAAGAARGATKLRAVTNAQHIFRLFGTNCALEKMTLDGSLVSGAIGLAMAPVNESQVAVTVQNNWCLARDLWIYKCAEGIILRPGPTVSGVDSGCFYQNLDNIHLLNCTRGIWAQNGPHPAPPSTRHTISKIRVGADGSGSCNTGIQLDACGTAQLSMIAFEGIQGVGPNAVATGLIIAGASADGANNDDNNFSHMVAEACTRDLELNNGQTDFAHTYFTWNKMLLNAQPRSWLGGDASQVPQMMSGYLYQNDGQIAGYENGTNYFRGATGMALETAATYAWRGDLDTLVRHPAADQIELVCGGSTTLALGNGRVRVPAKSAPSGPGGSLLTFDFPLAYVAGTPRVFEVSRGAVDATGVNYSHRRSTWVENASGVITEGTKILDVQGNAPAITTDTVTRLDANTIRVSVQIAKATIVFTNYASILQLT